MSPEVPLFALATRQHGVFTRAQALACGLSDRQIEWALRLGRWRSVWPGVYIAASTPYSWHARVTAACLSAGEGSVASFWAAASLWGLMDDPPEIIDVSRPHASHDEDLTGYRVHRIVTLARRDRSVLNGIPVTCIDRTLVDLARVSDRGRLEGWVDVALLAGLTTPKRIQNYVDSRRLQRLRGAGVLRTILQDRTRGIPESELERRMIALLRSGGVKEPERQRRRGPYRIDLLYQEERIAIELDGRSHLIPSRYRADQRRDRTLILDGWIVLRFTWLDLIETPDDVLGDVRRALGFRSGS